MKKFFASILCLGMIFGATGCTSGGDDTYEIAMITDSGSVTDKSFNQSAYEGVKEFGEKNDITYKYYAPKDTDQSGDSDTVVTSALKDVKGATIEALNAYKKDKFQGGKTIILKNTGGIVYPGLLKNFSKEDHDAVDKKIKDGSLELKSSADVNEKTGDPSGISFDNLTVNFE